MTGLKVFPRKAASAPNTQIKISVRMPIALSPCDVCLAFSRSSPMRAPMRILIPMGVRILRISMKFVLMWVLSLYYNIFSSKKEPRAWWGPFESFWMRFISFKYAEVSRFLLKNYIWLLSMSHYCIFESFQQNCLANFCFCLVAAFAEFALWTERIHCAKPVLVVDVFVRHILKLKIKALVFKPRKLGKSRFWRLS